MKLYLAHLFPELQACNGDKGNILILQKGAQWRNIEVKVETLSWDQPPRRLTGYDLIFWGSSPQLVIPLLETLLFSWAPFLKEAVEKNKALIAIGTAYQLLGESYYTPQREERPGIGVFKAHTVPGPRRLVGPIAVKVPGLDPPLPVVGFENHQGWTYLKGSPPLGEVIYGHGNNSQDKTEGAHHGKAWGTYLHGPLLSKNPRLADFLLKQALEEKYPGLELSPLDDRLELEINRNIFRRFLPRGHR